MTTTSDGVAVFEESGPELYAAFNTMLRLEKRWIPQVSGKGREHSFPYVPYPLGLFFSALQTARTHFMQFDQERTEPRRFLDVGCGIGTKVVLACQLGWSGDGLDFVPEYVEAARELVTNGSRIFQANALQFGEYESYDLVYAYRPLMTDERMAELVAYICDNTRPGTLLYLPTYEADNDKLAEFGKHIWVRE